MRLQIHRPTDQQVKDHMNGEDNEWYWFKIDVNSKDTDRSDFIRIDTVKGEPILIDSGGGDVITVYIPDGILVETNNYSNKEGPMVHRLDKGKNYEAQTNKSDKTIKRR